MQYINLHFLNNVFSCLCASCLYTGKLYLILYVVLNRPTSLYLYENNQIFGDIRTYRAM